MGTQERLEERLTQVEQGLLELRTELQKFRLEASRDNADLARGIKDDLRRLEAGQAEILALLRRPRWWPF